MFCITLVRNGNGINWIRHIGISLRVKDQQYNISNQCMLVRRFYFLQPFIQIHLLKFATEL